MRKKVAYTALLTQIFTARECFPQNAFSFSHVRKTLQGNHVPSFAQGLSVVSLSWRWVTNRYKPAIQTITAILYQQFSDNVIPAVLRWNSTVIKKSKGKFQWGLTLFRNDLPHDRRFCRSRGDPARKALWPSELTLFRHNLCGISELE